MDLWIPVEDGAALLREELVRTPGLVGVAPGPGGTVTARRDPNAPEAVLAPVVFSRQVLPGAGLQKAESIRAWADLLLAVLEQRLPPEGPWRLLVAARYDTRESSHAGAQRCRLIAEALQEQLRKRNRARLRAWVRDPDRPAGPGDSLVQLVLTEPASGWLSVAAAPEAWRLRRNLWPFPLGEIPVAVDKTAPSRAFAKLVEAEQRFGRRIQDGEECVDLGACPGSWTYVAVQRGASVTSVDRSPLRADLMTHPRVRFVQGDAFRFVPEQPVDWLLCDVIAAPERSIDLVLDWVKNRRARHFVVTIKFKGDTEYGRLDVLKRELPAHCPEFFLVRLCANRNEACVFGSTSAEA